tara:strand:- start:238 stop:408 length:171 start_codon:yes stop_codon:yes gene_type:complete
MQAKVLVVVLQTGVAPYQVLLGQVNRMARHTSLAATAALGSFYAIQLKTMVVTAFV